MLQGTNICTSTTTCFDLRGYY